MNIILYNNQSENTYVNKTLVVAHELNGTLRNECSVINPTIEVELPSIIDPIFNYAYIEEFNRYYFIDNIVSVRNGLWRLYMSVDVLMSFKNLFLGLEGMIGRNENNFNPYLIDNLLPIQYNKEYNIQEFTDKSLNLLKAIKPSNNASPCYVISIISPIDEVFGDTEPPEDSIYNNVPAMGVNPVIGSYKFYICNRTALKEFINSIINNSERASYVGSIRIFPFTKEDITNFDGRVTNILYFGETAVTYQREFYEIPLDYYFKESVTVTLPTLNITNSFLDYEPYSYYELFVPLQGWVSIDPINIIGKNITITYFVDFTDGNCRINVTNENNLIDVFECKVGLPLPINYTNLSDVERVDAVNKITLANNEISGIINAGTGVAMAVASGGTMGVGQAIGGATSMFTSGLDYVANQIMNVQRGCTAVVSSIYTSFMTPTYPILKHTYSVCKVDLNKFAKQYGRPLQEVKVFNTLSGFTTVKDIHIPVMGSIITDTELNTLYQNLAQGFHL